MGPYFSILIKRVNLETDMLAGRMPCEREGRDQGNVSTSQRTPKIVRKPPEGQNKE